MSDNVLQLKMQDGSLVDNPQIEGLEVLFKGKGSTVIIEDGSVFRNSKIIVANRCYVQIDKTSARGILNTQVDMSGTGVGRSLKIGSGISIESCRFAMVNESHLSITIGKNCLFSSNILFRVTDGHTIYDLDSKAIVNKSKPIVLGDNIWVSASAIFLKGAEVADNSIIGANALVVKKFEQKNVVLAGNPARIVRENIGWSRKYIDSFPDGIFVE